MQKITFFKKLELMNSYIPNNIIFNLFILWIDSYEFFIIIFFKDKGESRNLYLFNLNFKFSNVIIEPIILGVINLVLLIILIIFLSIKIKKQIPLIIKFWLKFITYIIFWMNTTFLLPFMNLIYNYFISSQNLTLTILAVILFIFILWMNYFFLNFFNQFSLNKNNIFNFINAKYFYYEIIFKNVLALLLSFTQTLYINVLISIFNFLISIDFLKNVFCLNLNLERIFLIKHLFFFIFPFIYELKVYYIEDSNFWIIYSFFFLLIILIFSNFLLRFKYLNILTYNKVNIIEGSNLRNYIILSYNIINNKNFNYLIYDLEYSLYYFNKKYFKVINEKEDFKFDKNILEYNNFLIKWIDYNNEEYNDVYLDLIYFQILFKFKKKIWKIILKSEKIKKNNIISSSLDFYLNKQINLCEIFFKKNKKETSNYLNLNVILDFEKKINLFTENISLFIFNYNVILYELNEETVNCNRILEISNKMVSILKNLKKEYEDFEDFEELKYKIDYIYIKFLFIILNKEKDGKFLLNKFLDNAIKNHQLNKDLKKNLNVDTVELNQIITNDNKYNILITSLKSKKIINSDNNIKNYLKFDKKDILNQKLDIIIPKYLKIDHKNKIKEFLNSSNIDIFHNKNEFYFINNSKFYLKLCKIKTKILNNLNNDILVYNFLNYNFSSLKYIVFSMNNYNILGITSEAKKLLNIQSKFTVNNPKFESIYKLNYIFDNLFENLENKTLELNKEYSINFSKDEESLEKVSTIRIELVNIQLIENKEIGILKVIDGRQEEKNLKLENSIKNDSNKKNNNNDISNNNTKSTSKDKNNTYENLKMKNFKILNIFSIIYSFLILFFLILLSYYSIELDKNIRNTIENIILIEDYSFYISEIVYLSRKLLFIKNNLQDYSFDENLILLANYTNAVQENKNKLLDISNTYLNNKNILINNLINNQLIPRQIDYFENLNAIISDSYKYLNYLNTYEFTTYKIFDIQNNELKKILYNVIYNGNGPLIEKLQELSNNYFEKKILDLDVFHRTINILLYCWIFLGIIYFVIIFIFFKLIKKYIKLNLQVFSFLNKDQIKFIIELLNNFKLRYLNKNLKKNEMNKLFNTNTNKTPMISFTKFMKSSKFKNNLYTYKSSIIKNIKNNKDKKVFDKIKYFNEYNYNINFYKKLFIFNFYNIFFMVMCFSIVIYSSIVYDKYLFSINYFKDFSKMNQEINTNYNNLVDSIIKRKNNPNLLDRINKFDNKVRTLFRPSQTLYKLSAITFINDLKELKTENLCEFIDYEHCNEIEFLNKSFYLSIEYLINNMIDIDVFDFNKINIFKSNKIQFIDNLKNIINRINIILLKNVMTDLKNYYNIKIILIIIYNVWVIILWFFFILIKKLKFFKKKINNINEIENLIFIIPLNIRENNDFIVYYFLENKDIKNIQKIQNNFKNSKNSTNLK